MSRNVYLVLIAQFLTAFADNAVLFTAITMIMQLSEPPSWYIPALQASFLVSFVLFAPWVGPFADSRSKPGVLTMANIVKGIGASLLLFQFEPLIAYAVIGLGAAVYSPAKYGILPELVDEKLLVKANGWIEGSTILAILLGTLVGAMVAEYSITIALMGVVGLYAVSGIVALFIDKTPIARGQREGAALPNFITMTRELLATPRARFATLGVSLFWSAATVLRVLLIAWAPVVLMLHSTTEVALLTMFVAIGIAIGSVLAPKFIPLTYLRRARMAAYAMGIVVVMLSFVDLLWAARGMLLLIGVAGGLFVVPINAALQEIGHRSVGAGGAVGIQNFFENLAMLTASGLYAAAAWMGAGPVSTMLVLGLLIIVAAFAVSWHLPPDTSAISSLTDKDDKP
ncbi:MAG: lysophospholipid transporter LplT [Ectothiorhodospiraceae bacterium]|nr:lysophospholipid transporter LplT [Ectothiorhodospiraceae bacterium]